MKNIFFFIFFGFLGVSVMLAPNFSVAQDADVPTETELSEEEQEKADEEKKKAEEEAKKKAEEEKEKKEEEERKEKAKKIEDDIEDIEKDLKKAEAKQTKAQNELNEQNAELNRQRYALEDTKKAVENKEAEIIAKDGQLTKLQDRIMLHKTSLESAMRQLYMAQDYHLAVRVFDHAEGEQFLLSDDQGNSLRDRIVQILGTLDQSKADLEEQKATLKAAKEEKEALLSAQSAQEKKLARLADSARDVAQKATATVDEINTKLSATESKLSSLLGVGVSTDDILDAAKFASKKTGVRKDFLLGMLIVETDLGRYTGGCTYKESNMNDHRKEMFKKITKELDYNYKKKKVSCPPSKYKGTGGAMGVAQFMSDTWWGYKDRIAAKTGNNPPDPWSLTDGVMAMALKLANDGATKESGEWGAASRYLGTCSTASTKFYCENVLWWADNYKKKL